MKITSTRVATEADAEAIADLANKHELSVDSKSSLFSEQGALDFIAGYIDSSPAYLLSLDGESGFSAVVNLHPDSVRGRYFTDVYARPQVENLENIVLWAIELAESEHPSWDIWPGVNSLDKRLQGAWASHGYEFLRRYYTMRMTLSSAPSIRHIEDLDIRAIDVTNPDLIALWHSAHQNSFSNHFGFAPRELEKWRELVLDSALDPKGVFLAFKNGEPVGFCQCNDEYAEENKGFVNLLGVTHEYQGLGIGEALLQTGIAYCLTKGYDSVELNVDTGNESGALKLYEKVGFRPESSWIQLHRPRS
jgi:ribosomal protein S18 acetylase RimI-like enzyme